MNIYTTQAQVPQDSSPNCLLPDITDDRISSFCDLINSMPIYLEISPRPLCGEYQCHRNVNTYVANYGGSRVLGYHFIEYGSSLIGVLHSVWRNTYGKLDDITESEHAFTRRLFVEINSTTTDNLPPSIYPGLQETEIESYKIGSFSQNMDDIKTDEFTF